MKNTRKRTQCFILVFPGFWVIFMGLELSFENELQSSFHLFAIWVMSKVLKLYIGKRPSLVLVFESCAILKDLKRKAKPFTWYLKLKKLRGSIYW